MFNFNKTLPHRSTWILERTLWKKGMEYVVGIDEVGKGAIAGPLVVAAVVLPIQCHLKNLNDSKLLNAEEREKLSQEILNACVAHVIVSGSNSEIDQEGITAVNRKLFQQSFDQLLPSLKLRQTSRMTMGGKFNRDTCFVAVDGRPIAKLPIEHEYIIDGDARVKTIAAASILAKVHRDALMNNFASTHHHYGFDKHKGYGTPRHWQTLEQYGPCPIHRTSFLEAYRIRKNQGSLV